MYQPPSMEEEKDELLPAFALFWLLFMFLRLAASG
jgi:hypothetical protein